jgi:hypothetical protein
MKIDSDDLAAMMTRLAREVYEGQPFHRRALMVRTEEEVRALGLWESGDDVVSGSVGLKSRGLANIDFRFSDLVRKGVFRCVSRGVWQLP